MTSHRIHKSSSRAIGKRKEDISALQAELSALQAEWQSRYSEVCGLHFEWMCDYIEYECMMGSEYRSKAPRLTGVHEDIKMRIIEETNDGDLMDYSLYIGDETVLEECNGGGFESAMDSLEYALDEYLESHKEPEHKSLSWDSPTESDGPNGKRIITSTAETYGNGTQYILSASEEYDGSEFIMAWAKVYDAIRNECVAADICNSLDEAKTLCETLLERCQTYMSSARKLYIGKRLAKASSLFNLGKSLDLKDEIDEALMSIFPIGDLYSVREINPGEFMVYFGPIFDTKEIASRMNECGVNARAIGYEVSVRDDYAASLHKSEDNYRGLPDVGFIWHGEWADPELEYKGHLVNYYSIDDAIYADFKEDHPEYDGKDVPDDIFDQYVQEHDYLVYEYLDAAIADAKSLHKSSDRADESDVETINSIVRAFVDRHIGSDYDDYRIRLEEGDYGRIIRFYYDSELYDMLYGLYSYDGKEQEELFEEIRSKGYWIDFETASIIIIGREDVEKSFNDMVLKQRYGYM